MARSTSNTDNSKVDSSEGLEKSSGIQDQTPARCILDTVAICFEGLWDPAQSRETRSLLLQSYHNALHILRVALLSDPHDQKLIAPTRSLAVYEMAVSSDWEDVTWRTHLDAYLAMLCQAPQLSTDSIRESSLAQALRFVDDKDNGQLSFNDPTKTDSKMAELLLGVSKLRLSRLSQELTGLYRAVSRPRKLDVQKLRFSVKRIHADLLSVSGLVSSSESKASKAFRIEHAAVRILTAGLLIECGDYLHSAEAFHRTREYISLASSISLASATICESVRSLLPATCSVSQTVVDAPQTGSLLLPSLSDVFSVMWPLFIVRSAKSQEQARRDWAEQTLYLIGKDARVPKALHLATSASGLGVLNHLPDTLAGLILASTMQ